jgi:YidC/Oxa1 family membrane protein insertase
MWNSFVELIRATIFAGAHVCAGSLGGSVLLVSFLVRLGLLPLTLRMARSAREQQRRLARLKPELDRLQRRFAGNPARLFAETQALQRRHGVRTFEPRSMIVSLAQLPLLGGLFSAVRNGLGAKVRFLWIADLARPNGLLLLGVATLSGFATWLAPSHTTPQAPAATLAVVLALATAAFLFSASSAVALSVGAGAAVQGLQNWLLARDARRQG